MKKYLLKERNVALDESRDVIVVGGGPAGCAAAAAAAREGARTLLIEATCALGGMGTQGLVPWFCGFSDGEKNIARGLAEHVLNAAYKLPSSCDAPGIDPELLKRVYDDMVGEAGASILFDTRLVAVEMAGTDKVDALIVSNKSGLQALRAKMYVDCTGDADLAAWAGAAFEKGDQAGRMQPTTLCFVITNVDEALLAKGPSIHFYDPNSPIHKAMKSDKYPLIIELHSCFMKIGPGTYGFNTGHVFDVDNTLPASLSAALIHGRKMAAQYRDAFAEYHPAFKNAYLVETGSLLGVRETRRIVGDYVLSIADYLARRSFADEICRNAYGIDVHYSKEETLALCRKSLDEIKQANNKLTRNFGKGESFGVPYRCLTPKTLKNVLVAGRCISTDRSVNGSVRIMACCLNTGEAAGMAGAMAAAGSRDAHAVDAGELRHRLKERGAYLPDVAG